MLSINNRKLMFVVSFMFVGINIGMLNPAHATWKEALRACAPFSWLVNAVSPLEAEEWFKLNVENQSWYQRKTLRQQLEYKTDMGELCKNPNLFVHSPSKDVWLVHHLEAIASGEPIISPSYRVHELRGELQRLRAANRFEFEPSTLQASSVFNPLGKSENPLLEFIQDPKNAAGIILNPPSVVGEVIFRARGSHIYSERTVQTTKPVDDSSVALDIDQEAGEETSLLGGSHRSYQATSSR